MVPNGDEPMTTARRWPGGGFAHEGIVELYHFPDGWWIGRVVEADKLSQIFGFPLASSQRLLGLNEGSVWFVLVDGLERYRSSLYRRRATDRIELLEWRSPGKVETMKSMERREPCEPTEDHRLAERWLTFLMDMVYGELPSDMQAIGPIRLPILIEKGIPEAMHLPEQEAELQALREQWADGDYNDDRVRKQIYDLGNSMVQKAFGRFWPTTPLDQGPPEYTINVHLRWPNLVDDLNITPYDDDTHTWSLMVSEYHAFDAPQLEADSLSSLWEAFVRYMLDDWGYELMTAAQEEQWWDDLPWGSPVSPVDFSFYVLLDMESPVVRPLSTFVAWAEAEGLF
jgi:hypothetical protein